MKGLIFEGRVERGEGIATDLGCPTANIAIEHGGVIPGLGVYTGEAEFQGHCYPAVVCINDGRTGCLLKMEVHFLDQVMEPMEGKFLKVRVFDKLRNLVPWESDTQMRDLIKGDLENARAWFEKAS